MVTGVQFTGTLSANQTHVWFTHGWPPASHVIWTMMPVSPQGAPELSWSVSVERETASSTWYWITVSNLTASPVTFEGRYAILS